MDKVLKRRLVGATILIALAVIFLPMLLVDSDRMPSGGDLAEMPPMPETARDVRRIPLDPAAARAPGSSRRDTDSGSDPNSDSSPGEFAPANRADEDRAPAARQERDRRPEIDDEIVLRPELVGDADDSVAASEDGSDTDPPAVPEPEPSEPEAPRDAPDPENIPDDVALGDWVVQVASFGSVDSAAEVSERLERLGHIVLRDEIVRGQTTLYRLRTGPYLSRDAAEQALQQISTTVSGVQPIVVELDEPVPAPAANSTDSGGFAVQVGSFIGENNAVAETGRLQGLDFAAFRFSEVVGEREIWRVRVGPVENRSAAEALLERLTEQAGVEGLVVSHP